MLTEIQSEFELKLSAEPQTIILDGHVHIHSCYNIDKFLDIAHRNLQDAQGRLGVSKADFCLLFSECANDDYFGAIAGRPSQNGRRPDRHIVLDKWKVRPTGEEESIVVEFADRRLILIAGCQVAAREGLEVLLLCTRHRVDDGLPIQEVLERARELQIPHVIPWGAGKWFFRRGKLLSDLVNDARSSGLFLGDEGGRPWFWPRPKHMKKAESVGVFDIPGTDPLPFPHDIEKVGKMGSILNVDIDAEHPAESVRRHLLSLKKQPRRFAQLEPLHRFFQNQFAMQLRKHGIAYQDS